MAITARQIVENAAKKLSILGRGQTLSADEADDGLNVLNAMLGSWSSDDCLIYTKTRETFSLTGAQSYTIGTSADFNTAKPLHITSAFVSQSDIDYPIMQANEGQYNGFAYKPSGGGPAEYYYYDNNYPIATIYLFPVPDSSYTITICSVKELDQFTTLNTVYDLPPAYKKALEFNLAVEWAPNYEKEASGTVQRESIKSLRNVKKINTKSRYPLSRIDSALLSNREGFNYYTGPFV